MKKSIVFLTLVLLSLGVGVVSFAFLEESFFVENPARDFLEKMETDKEESDKKNVEEVAQEVTGNEVETQVEEEAEKEEEVESEAINKEMGLDELMILLQEDEDSNRYEWNVVRQYKEENGKEAYLVILGNDEVIVPALSGEENIGSEIDLKFLHFEATEAGFQKEELILDVFEGEQELKDLYLNTMRSRYSYFVESEEGIRFCITTKEEDAHNINEVIRVYNLSNQQWSLEYEVQKSMNNWETGEWIEQYFFNQEQITVEQWQEQVTKHVPKGEFLIEEDAEPSYGNEVFPVYSRKTKGATWENPKAIHAIGEIEFASIASSVFEEVIDGKIVRYSVDQLFDKDLKTPWVEASQGDGVGEWIYLSAREKFNMETIEIAPGFCADEQLFMGNNRVKKLRIIASNGEERVIDVDSENISFQSYVVGLYGITSVRIYIEEVALGESYNDLCISELGMNGEQIRVGVAW